MKFNELAIGEWFTDATEWFVPSCVLMKVSDTEVIPINWNCVEKEEFPQDGEVRYCSQFICSLRDGTVSSIDYERTPFEFEHYNGTNFSPEHRFNSIPIGAIYRGKGQTYYKRITDKETLVIWSPKQETMGKIFVRDDYETHIGTYYVCFNGWFKYPEEGHMEFPNMVEPLGLTF